MKNFVQLLILFCMSHQMALAQVRAYWPHTIQARTKDSGNKDLFVMVLGAAVTPLADASFDPAKDEIRSKDGSVKQNYYKDSLGIKYFKPIDKSIFPLPPSGWCSWYFYYQEIDENEIKRNAKWIADNLKDFGAQYVQIDDGWQGTGHGLGENRDWTTIDKRFPGGMSALAAYIKSLGLKPGIWLAPHGQSNKTVVDKHPGVFMYPELRDKVSIPDVLLQSHSASLQIEFYTGKMFPAEYRNDAFAAQHGSWNRARRTGYKVIRLPQKNGVPTGEYEDFMTGFVTPEGDVWGRPVGVTVGKDGSLFVTDDGSNTIWRVTYTGK